MVNILMALRDLTMTANTVITMQVLPTHLMSMVYDSQTGTSEYLHYKVPASFQWIAWTPLSLLLPVSLSLVSLLF